MAESRSMDMEREREKERGREGREEGTRLVEKASYVLRTYRDPMDREWLFYGRVICDCCEFAITSLHTFFCRLTHRPLAEVSIQRLSISAR